jgi:hypothetical protein
MDEDIRFPVFILGATGAVTLPFVCPYACTVRDLIGAVAKDPGDDETITLTNVTQSVTLGVLLFGNDIAANAKGVWTADSTEGETVNAEGDVLLFTISTLAQAAIFSMILELDPKCRAV